MMSRLCLKKYRFYITGICLWLCTEASYGQGFDVIPDSIQQDSKAVFLLDEARFQIFSTSKIRFSKKQIITIFTPEGAHFAYKGVNYVKASQIILFKASVFDKTGTLIKSLKKSEFEDHSNISDGSIFEDDRVRVADLRKKTYPYTVEFEYEVEYSSLFFTPSWIVQPDEKVGVLKSRFEIIGSKDLIPNYKLYNSDQQPHKEVKDNQISLKWEWGNLKPIRIEPFNSDISYYTPVIKTTPQHFVYGGYSGDLNHWSSFGQWIASLNKDRDQLPEATRAKMRELVEGASSEREKIKRIYNYLQQNTRYVSVQLGIGGLQPIDASTVDQKKYGDCKALSNYTMAMLKAVGIESVYILVEAGDFPSILDKDFADDPFNHVILAVPTKTDTVWLECTSQTNPFGYLGKFTSDREILMITEHGGVIARTPEYTAKDNQQLTQALVQVDDTGNAKATFDIKYSGLQHENGNLNYYLRQGPEEQKKWIYNNFDVPSFNLLDYKFEYEPGEIPLVKQNTTMEIPKLASVSGKRMFLKVNLNNKITYIPKALDNRKVPIVKRFEYYDYDSIVYSLPIGYSPESIPESVELTSQFGSYQSKVTVNGRKITYIRTVTIRKGIFPQESYNELREFHIQMVKADKQKIVMLNEI